MQTFLPYASFKKTAECLDYKRLGKQRVEAYQILNVLSGNSKSKGWINHPAVLMWKGYEECLKLYTNCMIEEWIKRGYKNTMKTYSINRGCDVIESLGFSIPSFIGDENFHSSHRANLLRKDFKYYSKYNWKESNQNWWEIEYIWPTKEN